MFGSETEISRGELGIGRLESLMTGISRFRRQIAADLVHLGADFGQRLVRVVIQLEPRGDGRRPCVLCDWM